MSESWYGSDSKCWAVVGMIAATAILGTGLIYMATAQAQPGCTASNLSSTLGGVASQTGGWLVSHPEAEAAVNTADENTIRTYFATHQAEWSELRGIASPLRSLRQSCPQQVSPGDVARLYDAMAS
jgi:hemophore-related protein